MPIIIRRAREADAPALAALNDDVQAVHAAALPWLFKPPGPETRAAVAALVEERDNLLFIAEADGLAAGYAFAQIIRLPETAFQFAHGMVYLHHISVRAEHRRRGIATALIGAVRTAGEQEGVSRVALDVWTFNEAARAFFRSQGFAPWSEKLWNR
jgi:ribosomal protein S18 acetylase RimI-like enzyme